MVQPQPLFAWSLLCLLTCLLVLTLTLPCSLDGVSRRHKSLQFSPLPDDRTTQEQCDCPCFPI